MDQSQNGQNVQVEGTQPQALPPQTNQAPQVAPAIAPDQAPVQPQEDRTAEQFQKILAKNKELSDKLSAYEAKPKDVSVMEAFKPPSVGVTEIPEIKPDENGYVDLASLNQMRQQVNEALKTVRTVDQKVIESEQRTQTKEVYSAHPELNPLSANYDPRLSEFVRLKLLQNMTEGKEPNYMEAAAHMKTLLGTPQATVPQAAQAPQETPAQVQKIQAQPLPTGQGGQSNVQQPKNREQMLRGSKQDLGKYLTEAGY